MERTHQAQSLSTSWRSSRYGILSWTNGRMKLKSVIQSHFTELKYGPLSGDSASEDNTLRCCVSGSTKWSTQLQADNWYNFAYDIDFDTQTVGLWASNGSDPLTQVSSGNGARPRQIQQIGILASCGWTMEEKTPLRKTSTGLESSSRGRRSRRKCQGCGNKSIWHLSIMLKAREWAKIRDSSTLQSLPVELTFVTSFLTNWPFHRCQRKRLR